MKQKMCAIGEALIDFIPQQKACALKDVEGFVRVAGGAPANVAAAVARLGIDATVLTQLGQDAFGDYIIECLAKSGIDTSHILQTDQYDTSLAFVSLKEDGDRDFKFYRKSAADLQYSPDNITADLVKEFGAVHFCSVSLVESPMKQAHKKLLDLAIENKVLISFDPNLRLSLWNDDEGLKKSVQEFLPYADIIKISDEELEFITGCTKVEDALDRLFEMRCQCLVYTKGKDGATVYRRNDNVSSKGYTVDVVDTTGAGDSFIGAFLYCLLKDEVSDISSVSSDTLKEYLDFANLYAAHTTTIPGALDAMANHEELEAFKNNIK